MVSMLINRIETGILLFVIFLAGCRSGKIATVDFPDGAYQGEIDRKGKKNGKGVYKWHDGSTYEGDFEEDLRHGNGHFKWANGESYKGDYLRDERTGHGTYNWPDGSSYEGSFLNGKRHGLGTYVSSDRDIYVGEWFDDLQHGEGTLTRSDGSVIKGIWRNGKLLTVPSVIPPKANKPTLTWKQSAATKEQPQVTEVASWRKDKPVQPITPSTKPIATQTFPVVSEPSTQETASPPPTLAITTPIEKERVPSPTTSVPEVQPKDLPTESESPPTIQGSGEDQNIWEGNREEAELHFITYLINGIDTIFEKKTKAPFSGKMRVTDPSGNILGEFEVLNGRMDGEEVYFDAKGFVTERTIWSNGREIR